MKFALATMLVAAMGLGFGASAANAATVDLLVTGKVTVVGAPGGVISPLAVDDIVTFHLTYETPSVDTDPGAGHGSFKPFTTVETSFNGNTYAFSAPDTTFNVTNGASDVIQISNNVGPGGPGGILSFDVGFSDVTGAALGDDSLPTDLLTLQAMNGSFGFFLEAAGGFPIIITGAITSVAAVATTPIPAALPLLASALGGLGFLGWRRRRYEQKTDAVLEVTRA